MATFIKRGTRWQAQVRTNGKSSSRTFDTKIEARLWAAQIEAGVVVYMASQQQDALTASPRSSPEATLGVAFNTLLDKYEELHLPHIRGQVEEMSRLRRLRTVFGGTSLENITQAALVEYRERRLRDVGNQTVKHELNLILRILRMAANEWGVAIPNGVPFIKLPKLPRGRTRRLDPSEQERLYQVLPEMVGRMMVFSLETALRRGELVSMQWQHIDLHKRLLLVPETKSDEPRTIPLSTTAVRLLRSLPMNTSGKVWSLGADSVSQAFSRACRRLNIQNLHWHDLRHEAISRLVERGLNTMEASLISGHRTLACLQRYTHLKAENLLEKIG